MTLLSTFSSASSRGFGTFKTSGGGGGSSGPTGTLKILLAGAESTASWVQDVATNLTTASAKYTGLTLSITQVSGSSLSFPTVSVGQYDTIFFWTDSGATWNSSFDTHNANNGGLVTAQFFGSVAPTSVTSALMPTVPNSGGQNGGVLTWSNSTHAIGQGFNGTTQKVTSFVSGQTGAGFAATNPTLNSGATTVATASNGQPFVVVKDNTAPTGRTVFLNMFPPSNSANSYSSGWSMASYPDGALLMLNALLWSARKL